MEFQPLDGNPSSGWKSHQGLVGFPSICPKMAGWKSNHPSVKGRQGFMISFQIFYFSFLEFSKLWKWKWITIHSNLEIFFSWDEELSWAVSCLNRMVPFWSWCWAQEKWTWCLLGGLKGPSIDDSCSAMSYTSGFFALQLQRLHQPGYGSGEEASFVFCILATKVAIKYLCICLFVPEWVRFRVGFIKVCYEGECSRRPFSHFSAFTTFQLKWDFRKKSFVKLPFTCIAGHWENASHWADGVI